MRPSWKIDELAEAVRQVLEAGNLAQPSGRVRDVPDLRTIRYYTTLGLLDRPLEMQGRTAYYGWRHVWQLLAIKRLQLAGVPLAEIQQRLAGADDRTLKKVAEVPERLVRAVCRTPLEDKPPVEPPTRSSSAFWAEPAAVAPRSESVWPAGEASPAARRALLIKLGEGVTLMLEGVEPEVFDRDRLAAIESAGRGLIDQLQHLGVLETPTAVERLPAQKGAGHDPSHSTL
jgi:DNA-binding transcriptional MerR regulator